MKTRILMSVLAIGLSIALIGGATMAWFTDEAEVPEATFTAGTVEIDVDGPFDGNMEGFVAENVNPGDEYEVKWVIRNAGTKDAEIRVSLNGLWEATDDQNLLERLVDGNQEYLTSVLNGELEEEKVVDWEIEGFNDIWKIYKDSDGEEWLYYADGPLKGTYGREEEEEDEITLTLKITFDGPDMDNKYMDAKFTVEGFVEAIQASNDAPAEVWGGYWNPESEV
jgi:predicted ribosomally synthesized peptide with SipW-like signal peptide